MSGWLRALPLAVALMVGTWALLLLLARRAPRRSRRLQTNPEGSSDKESVGRRARLR
jgi:hypothetical protein